jgi:ABC-type transport system involved in multi-copper enzyme maturation permease subunit
MLADLAICCRIAHRARITHFLGAIAVVLLVACFSAAQFSARQPATVALDVGFSVLRLFLPLMAILLLQELFYREFDRKYYLLSLTYPRTRLTFLIGRGVAVLASTLGGLFLLALVLNLIVELIGRSYAQSTPPNLGSLFTLTVLFMALDLVVVVAVGTLISIAASSASFVLVGTLGFMLCARSFSPIIDLLAIDSTLVSHAQTYQSSLTFLGYLFPDLAKLDVRMISLYNSIAFLPGNWPTLVVTTCAYTLAIFCLSAWLLARRRFV